MQKIQLQSIAFDPEGGVEVSFYLPLSDFKEPGLAMIRTFIIAPGREFSAEVQAVVEAGEDLVRDALDSFEKLPSVSPDTLPS